MKGASMGIKKIFVVEDQELLLTAYKSIFSEGNGYHLSGMTSSLTFPDIKEKLSLNKPDLLLLGMRLLTLDIVEEIKRIRNEFPGVGIILTFASYQSAAIKMLNSPAKDVKAGMAVFLKQSLQQIDQLFKLFVSVGEGHFILDPSLSSLLLSEKHEDLFLKELTRRELEILKLISEGYSNSAMADILYIDIKTVRHHINNIYSKLKTEEDFNLRHPRVRATRRYLATKGELINNSDT